MQDAAFEQLETYWVDGEPGLRWRSAPGAAGAGSCTALLEVPRGCGLPRHADSAEEIAVVVSGTAGIEMEDEASEIAAGGVALIPQDVPHRVFNAGDEPLRFVAVYAGTDVVTRYETVVQPSGRRSESVG